MDRMMRLREVARVLGIGSSTLWEQIQREILPAPAPVGQRSVAWPESEVAFVNAMSRAHRDGTLADLLAARAKERGGPLEAWVVNRAAWFDARRKKPRPFARPSRDLPAAT
jgi:predicted DNA-binding transcriptional regulator AlpA